DTGVSRSPLTWAVLIYRFAHAHWRQERARNDKSRAARGQRRLALTVATALAIAGLPRSGKARRRPCGEARRPIHARETLVADRGAAGTAHRSGLLSLVRSALPRPGPGSGRLCSHQLLRALLSSRHRPGAGRSGGPSGRTVVDATGLRDAC